jgi:hypothetical protein
MRGALSEESQVALRRAGLDCVRCACIEAVAGEEKTTTWSVDQTCVPTLLGGDRRDRTADLLIANLNF